MGSFTKIDHNIIHSTVWKKPPHIKHTWTTMLILTDKDGIVSASIPGLADQSGFSIEQTKEALECFLSPDEYSRTAENEGRRIEKVNGGWKILNFEKYRGETREERIKRQNREATQRWREKQITEHHEASQNITEHHGDAQKNRTEEKRIKQNKDKDKDKDKDFQFVLRKTDVRMAELAERTKVPKKELMQISYEKSLPVDRKKSRIVSKGSLVWNAYSEAYELKYNIPPKRNAKQNSICVKLVDRLGVEDAIGVAAYYPSVRNAFDCARGHALEILLKDCEKHCTAWKTGQQITQTKAQETDRLAKEGDDWREIIEKHKIKEKMKGQVL